MADLNKPVTNPVLSQELEQLHRENTPANQDRVLDEVVLRAHFLAPVVLGPQAQQAPGGEKTAVQFQLITAQDGRAFLPAFTDWPQLRKLCGPKDQKTVVLTFDDYAALLAGDKECAGFVVNPFGCPLTLDRELVANLAKKKRDRGQPFQTLPKGTKVLLGAPAHWPQDLADALSRAAGELPDVKGLYLRTMSRPGQLQPSYLVVVDHTGARESLFPLLADAARPHLGEKYVDLISLDSDLGRAAVKNAQPFFSR